jgi:hypothetical protein
VPGRRSSRECAGSLPARDNVLRGGVLLHGGQRPAQAGPLRPPPGKLPVGRRAVLATAERLYFNGGGAAGLRRGYNVLCFEGPGQSGACLLDNSLVFRYDYEVPIGAVIDYAVSRPDVDPGRIAAIGYSMGGYFVPRAAAFDKRIAACVADCLLPDAYALPARHFQPPAPDRIRLAGRDPGRVSTQQRQCARPPPGQHFVSSFRICELSARLPVGIILLARACGLTGPVAPGDLNVAWVGSARHGSGPAPGESTRRVVAGG